MNKREGVLFLWNIVAEIQSSLENPVVLFTQKDYSIGVFQALTDIREAMLEKAKPDKISTIVTTFHHQWLEAVQEVEKFKKRVKETPRDVVLNAIDFTTDCTTKRYKRLRKYIDDLRYILTDDEYNKLSSDINVVDEMTEIVISALSEKKKYIRTQADQTEYHVKIQDEIEELMNWLDKQHDNLAVIFCKVLNLKTPVSPTDLTKTLKQVIDEVAADPTPEAQRIAELINIKGKILGSMIRISSINELEIAKVIEKIQSLKERIDRLEDQNSSALMALKHKAMYLEERLQSLENIRTSVKRLKAIPTSSSALSLSDREVHIFNHILPHHDRCRLVEQLVQLWNSAILVHDHESIISILSVADLKEIFSDEKGCFTVDRYGRKIYSKGDDEVKYQLDEHNELVPVEDDDRHVYFYDACGRYYINDTRERVYKDHEGASEYILNKAGYLVKVLEKVNGTEYYYDWLGRYRVNEKGRHIYCEENSSEEYEHDGLGNLVKIHDPDTFCYDPCPIEPITTEENKYLQTEVGTALKECIAAVVLHQPNDPIIYLSQKLVKFHNNIIDRQNRILQEQERLQIQRYIQSQMPKFTTAEHSDVEDENENDIDSNFLQYEHKTENEEF
ncbi:unnamed protein product [Chrysodeixis includens]|uniref:Uncharacterized protein n=1 Tax=Chrysodeixis includens TaxID=689277 RepID=A0A9P0C1X8_CHRIL|nr:unnamed protein product [Chrysodeixis includens]